MARAKRHSCHCPTVAAVLSLAVGCGALGPGAVPLAVAPAAGDVIEEKECIDFWTFVHIASGYHLGERLGEEGLAESMVLLLGYELLEPEIWPDFNENQLNQECDIAAGVLGWLGWYAGEGDGH